MGFVLFSEHLMLKPNTTLILSLSYLYEPEGNACSVTDSTAEEHVLALVEHSADEARDRINRYMPSSKVLTNLISVHPRQSFTQTSHFFHLLLDE